MPLTLRPNWIGVIRRWSPGLVLILFLTLLYAFHIETGVTVSIALVALSVLLLPLVMGTPWALKCDQACLATEGMVTRRIPLREVARIRSLKRPFRVPEWRVERKDGWPLLVLDGRLFGEEAIDRVAHMAGVDIAE
jgi:hypothetical protein